MLVGEPGIGKTRLAEEFAVYARLRGAQFLTGHSYEGAVDVAYSPFVEAFRQYVRARPDVELRRELGEGAPDVANLVSEIRQRFPDLPASPPLQGDAERQRLFGSVTDFLRSATAASPLVLHLDDLHWSDKPSLLLLRHLARHLASDRLLILGTYRDVELDRTHPLAGYSVRCAGSRTTGACCCAGFRRSPSPTCSPSSTRARRARQDDNCWRRRSTARPRATPSSSARCSRI
jgi:predicted ATPase